MGIQGFKSVLKGWQKKHPIAIFILSFIFMMVVFYGFYFSPGVQDHFFSPLVNFYAAVSSVLLNAMNYRTIAESYTISSSQFSTSIRAGCDAVEAMAIFISGILAFPSSVRKKIKGLVSGISLIFILNIVRILSLFMAGVYSHSLFDTLHLVVWQIIFILFPIGLWLLWLRKAISKPILK